MVIALFDISKSILAKPEIVHRDVTFVDEQLSAIYENVADEIETARIVSCRLQYHNIKMSKNWMSEAFDCLITDDDCVTVPYFFSSTGIKDSDETVRAKVMEKMESMDFSDEEKARIDEYTAAEKVASRICERMLWKDSESLDYYLPESYDEMFEFYPIKDIKGGYVAWSPQKDDSDAIIPEIGMAAVIADEWEGDPYFFYIKNAEITDAAIPPDFSVEFEQIKVHHVSRELYNPCRTFRALLADFSGSKVCYGQTTDSYFS